MLESQWFLGTCPHLGLCERFLGDDDHCARAIATARLNEPSEFAHILGNMRVFRRPLLSDRWVDELTLLSGTGRHLDAWSEIR